MCIYIYIYIYIYILLLYYLSVSTTRLLLLLYDYTILLYYHIISLYDYVVILYYIISYHIILAPAAELPRGQAVALRVACLFCVFFVFPARATPGARWGKFDWKRLQVSQILYDRVRNWPIFKGIYTKVRTVGGELPGQGHGGFAHCTRNAFTAVARSVAGFSKVRCCDGGSVGAPICLLN